jgi:hypothetical protein
MALDFDALTMGPCIASFGNDAVYLPGAGAEVFVKGIFSEFASRRKVDDEGMVEVISQPSFTYRASDIPFDVTSPAMGEGIFVSDRLWVIATPPEPDSGGKVTLYLMIAPNQ